MRQRLSLPRLGIAIAIFAVSVSALLMPDLFETSSPQLSDARIPMAVLGDSDSHGYRDSTGFPLNSELRGGAFRQGTLQWTEVLADLRPSHVDLGARGRWGSRRWQAPLQRLLGLPYRLPRKEDHRYNFAWAGAQCQDLTTGEYRQAERLLHEMDRAPARWRAGVVVVRIGINTIGMADSLAALARDAAAPEVVAKIDQCATHVRTAVEQIARRHPATRWILVGILDNADWPPYFGRWQSGDEIRHIERGLDRYDRALQQLAAADPGRRVFVDDRAWFVSRWGARGPDGRPAYHPVVLADGTQVQHAQGNHPRHSVLQDGHAGLVWNALWAQSLVALMDASLDARVPSIRDDEIVSLVQRALASRDHSGQAPNTDP